MVMSTKGSFVMILMLIQEMAVQVLVKLNPGMIVLLALVLLFVVMGSLLLLRLVMTQIHNLQTDVVHLVFKNQITHVLEHHQHVF